MRNNYEILKLMCRDGFISYNKKIAKRIGINAAILFGEFCNIFEYFGRQEFYFEQAKIENDTALSKFQIQKATELLVKSGLLSVSRKGIPCKNWYTINIEKLMDFLLEDEESIEQVDEKTETRSKETSQPEVKKLDFWQSNNLTACGRESEHLLNKDITEDITEDITHTSAREEIQNKKEKNNVGELQKTIFKMISAHNSECKPQKRIALSSSFMSFIQKEMRELVDSIGVDAVRNEPDMIVSALRNYLSVAKSDTWKTSFSWRSFVRCFADFTPEYFSMAKYIDTKKDSTEPGKRPQDLFYFSMKDNPRFNDTVFRNHWDDWLVERPQGEMYFDWQRKWEETDADRKA